MLRNQDEQELRQILMQTQHNTDYVDQEIKDLIDLPEESPLKSMDSSQYMRSSEGSQGFVREQLSIGSNVELPHQSQPITDFISQKIMEKYEPPPDQPQHIFDPFYNTINKNLKPQTLEQVRNQYPLFLLSQPQYEIKNNIKEINLSYSAELLRKNVIVMDAGYCQQQKVYKVAVGTDDGQVIVFEPNSSKPHQIIECFDHPCSITCVKWSKNLQYLALANDQNQLYVYNFKHAITIQNHISYRILKTPVEYFNLGLKQLKNIIIQIYFVEEMPFQMLIVDENNVINKVIMKKHFIHMRPYLEQFQCPVNDFLDLCILNTIDQNKNKGTFIAASGHQLVTLCQIDPLFDVAMVYDKDKHGINIKKRGYPQISFREHPSSLMVVWDKYLQIVDMKITNFYPPTYSFSISHKFLLPDSTIHAGFLSNSIIYQVTRVGLKLFSTTTFQKQLSNHFQSKQILNHKITYQSLCHGQRIELSLSNHNIQLPDLRYLKGLFSTTNRTLFYCTKKGINMIYMSTLQQYLMNLVENNYWKISLQILKNCHLGLVHQLDQINQDFVQSKTKELSLRYINFLETVVLADNSKENSTLPLWNQQLIFIFNIIISVGLEQYLLNQIIPKIYKLKPQYLSNLTPFILTNKLTQCTPTSLELLLPTLPKQIVSKLIFNLQISNNDPQLPHQINNLLIENQMYLELVDLNQKFNDHFTATAVLVGIYLKLELDHDRNIMELTQDKRNIGQLMAYSIFDTFSSINFNKYSKKQNRDIVSSTLPLVTDQVISILIKESPTALFEHIIEELYLGQCLQTLNQLQLTNESNLMHQIISGINYSEVTQFKCQKKYWIAIFKLYSRKIVEINVYGGLTYLCLEDHINRDYIQKFVNKCEPRIIQQLTLLQKNELNMFFQRLLMSQHICLVKLVGRLLKRHVNVLQNIFRQNSQRNVKIYEYLDQCLPQLSQQQLELLKTLLKENIQLLTDIDPGRASDIITKHYLTDLNLFIHDLEQYPNQQLKLIHAVLLLYSYKQSLFDLKVKYLQLLAITYQHEVILSELMKEDYPLDQSLQICQKYAVLEAKAYLLVKSGGQGNINAAIQVYFQVIWQKIVKTVLNSTSNSQDYQKIIMNYVNQCINICIQFDLEDHQFEWFSILQQLQLLKKNITKNKVFDYQTCYTLKIIINKKAYPELVKMLIKQVTYYNLIHYLGLKLGEYDIQAIDIVIGQMVKNYLYEKEMHKILQESFTDTEKILRKELFNKQLRGFATDDYCDLCHAKGGLLVHYKCGHEIHPACGQDVRQCNLCKYHIPVIFQKRIDTLLKIKPEILSGGIAENLEQVQHQIQKESKLQRMTLYEDLSIIDLSQFDY